LYNIYIYTGLGLNILVYLKKNWETAMHYINPSCT